MSNRYLRKIVHLDSLISSVTQHRRAGRTLVHCHGCFDVIHPGHLRYLQFARRQGDVLLVSLTSDAGIDKGALHPYIPEELRAENLAALEMVDLVYLDPNPTAARLLEAIKPDVYVKGKEYETSDDPGFAEERRIVEAGGGTVIFSSGDIVYSSTRLLESMGASAAMHNQGELKTQGLPWVLRRHDVTAESLSRIIDAFAAKRVIVVGDIIIDRYVHCDALNVAAESPMLSLTQLDSQRYLGGTGVVARHLSALGASPFVLSQCGFDERSEWAMTQMQAENIDAHLLRCSPSVPEKSRFLVEETKLLKVEEADASPLDSVSQKTAASILLDQASSADAVIFCDYGYGMVAGSWLDRALPELRHMVNIISADVSGVRGVLLRFTDVDVLTPTERELRAAVHDYESGLSSVAWNVMDKTRARRLLVTLGKNGLVAFDRASQDIRSPDFHARLRSEQLPALAEHAVDHLGCGDALLAVSTLAMACGASFIQAAYLGSVAAATEAVRVGNLPVARTALRRWLTTMDAVPSDRLVPVPSPARSASGDSKPKTPPPVRPDEPDPVLALQR